MTKLSDLTMVEVPLSTGASAIYHDSEALRERFTFTSNFDPTPIPLYRADLGLIQLPRAVCPLGVDDRALGDEVEFEKCPEPRSHQVELFDEVRDFLLNGQSGVVCAHTGWGKTPLGLYAIHLIGRKAIIVVTKDDVAAQWAESAHVLLGVPKHRIGAIKGNYCQIIDTDIVIANIQSLSKADKYPAEVLTLLRQFGTIVFDEVHRLAADKFSNAAFMLPAKYRIGLSATPKRKDGKDIVIQAHIGPVRAQSTEELMVPRVLRFASSWACPRVYKKLKDPVTLAVTEELIRLPHDAGKTAHIERIIAADPERNRLIASMVEEALLKGRKIAVFSTQHEHLKAIIRICNTALKISMKQMGLYVGAVGKSEIEHRDREAKKDVLFSTYIMLGEGTDIPWLDTAILAMPRSNVTQPVGRIRRSFEGKHDPVVVDLVDNDSLVFAGYAASRLKWYKSIGCEVKDII